MADVDVAPNCVSMSDGVESTATEMRGERVVVLEFEPPIDTGTVGPLGATPLFGLGLDMDETPPAPP